MKPASVSEYYDVDDLMAAYIGSTEVVLLLIFL